MDLFGKKLEKGHQKRYDLWLQDQLNDYHLELEQKDPLEKYNLAVLDDALHVEIVNGKRRHFRRKPRQEKAKRIVCNPDFDGIAFFKTISAKGPISSWILYLTARDFYALLRTTKFLSALLDCKNVWDSFMKRDFSYLYTDLMYQTSLKDLYKYYSLTKKIGISYHTGTFLDTTLVASEAELARTLIEMTPVTNPKISQLLELERLNNGQTGHLKLSWFKAKNEILLWFSGYDVLSQPLTFKANSRVLSVYKLSKEEVLQKAFILGNKYLVLQVQSSETQGDQSSQPNQQIKDLQKPEIDRTRTVFYFYDLINEIEAWILRRDKTAPVTYSFWPKARSFYQNNDAGRKEDTCSSETDVNVFLELDNESREEEKEGKISVRLLEDDKILFFLQNKKFSFFTIFDGREHTQLFQTKLEFESPLIDVIQAKLRQVEDHSCLYAIDEESNMYKISYAINTLLDVSKIHPQKGTTVNRISKNPIFERFPNSKRKYYHGINKEQASQTEYVILFKKGSSFQFVELSSLQVYEFHLPEDVEFDYISDWNIQSDKLYVITNESMGIWRFSLDQEFTIKQLAYPIQTQWKGIHYYKQWVYADPCFTVLISCYGTSIKDCQKLEILVNSTQLIEKRICSKATYDSHNFEVDRILMRPQFLGEDVNIVLEDLEIKFEHGKLLISSSNYSFFLDLTNSRSIRLSRINPWRGKTCLDLSKVNLPDVGKAPPELMKSRNKKHRNVTYKTIPVIKQQTWRSLKKVQVDWSSYPKKNAVVQELMKERQLIRRKGYKYIKNIRQNDRSEKFREVDTESDETDDTEFEVSGIYFDDE